MGIEGVLCDMGPWYPEKESGSRSRGDLSLLSVPAFPMTVGSLVLEFFSFPAEMEAAPGLEWTHLGWNTYFIFHLSK